MDAMAWMARSRADACSRGMHLGSVGFGHSLAVAGGVILILTSSQRKAPTSFSAPAMSVNLVLSPGRPWRLAALGRGHTEAERCLPASPVATMPMGGAAGHELDATRPCEGAWMVVARRRLAAGHY